jgi:hypothetical protein
MLAALVGGALCAWWLWSGTATRPAVARAAVALAATALIAELLPMRTRYGTPWAVIYHLPGAGAMRAIDRIALVAGLAAVLALTAAASEIWAHRVGLHSLTRAAVVVGLTLAVLEQVNTTPNSVISRRVQTRLLSSAAQAPRRCRAFYVIDSKNATLPDYESQIDAMLISQNLGLPTVNGYTAYKPIGWDLSVVGSPDYAFTLRDWLQRESVRVPMCQLDLATMRWQGP